MDARMAQNLTRVLGWDPGWDLGIISVIPVSQHRTKQGKAQTGKQNLRLVIVLVTYVVHEVADIYRKIVSTSCMAHLVQSCDCSAHPATNSM